MSIYFLIMGCACVLIVACSALVHSMTNREAIQKILDGKPEEARQLIEKS